MSAKIMISCQQ